MKPHYPLLGLLVVSVAVQCSIYDDALLSGSGGRSSSRSTDAGGSTDASGTGGGFDGSSTSASVATTQVATTDASSSSDASSSRATSSTEVSSSVSSVQSSSSTGIVAGVVWINEIHYDNAGADAGEGVELAGTAQTDLTGWSLVAYNGSAVSVPAGSVTLSGLIPNQSNAMGTRWFAVPNLENGPSDGVALVNAAGMVVQFLSYEGVIVAAAGPAVGMTSTGIGVDEEPAPPVGTSLQLTGSGSTYSNFAWVENVTASPDMANAGQTFVSQ